MEKKILTIFKKRFSSKEEIKNLSKKHIAQLIFDEVLNRNQIQHVSI